MIVGAGDVLDWGYVFDRNADGMIDYLAFLVGAIPVRPEGFKGDLPKRGGRISADQINLYNQHARLVFTHIADDNFDGMVDGLVYGVREPDDIWIDRWVAARSDSAGQVADPWYFTMDITSRTGAPTRSGGGWAVSRVGAITALLDARDFASWSDYIARLNRAAQACGLGAGDFAGR